MISGLLAEEHRAELAQIGLPCIIRGHVLSQVPGYVRYTGFVYLEHTNGNLICVLEPKLLG